MAHIINLIVKDGLVFIETAINKIREFVKLIRSSPANYQHFKEFIVRRYPECQDKEAKFGCQNKMERDIFDARNGIAFAKRYCILAPRKEL